MDIDDRLNLWAEYARSNGDPLLARQILAAELTTMDSKLDLYAQEPEFRVALAEFARRGSGDHTLTSHDVGLGVFRPDAIHYEKVSDILRYYRRVGLMPVAVVEVRVPASAVYALWRYQLNAATISRITLMTELFAINASLVVLFRRTQDAPFPHIPASVVMADVKGEGDPALREGWELRSIIDSPHKLESYFHVADEPADVIRDGGLILGPHGFVDAWKLADAGFDATEQLVVRAKALRKIQEGHTEDLWSRLRLADTLELSHHELDNLVNDSGSAGWWRQPDGGQVGSDAERAMRSTLGRL